MTEILQKEDPILRKIATAVPIEEITSKKIRDVIERMKKALHAEDDGVAIAAPQIGESIRLFITNDFLLEKIRVKRKKLDLLTEPIKDSVYINPEFIKLSKKKKKMDEGCLSARWLYGEVERSDKATISAYDEHGNKFEKGAAGLLAQIFQHEIDHLEGILFLDKAENIIDNPPESETIIDHNG